ncbi:MAG: hypothetical protein WKF68_00050 [Daejeonella sp.]
MKDKISRKNFIKSCSATLGLLSVGMQDVFANPVTPASSPYTGKPQDTGQEGIIICVDVLLLCGAYLEVIIPSSINKARSYKYAGRLCQERCTFDVIRYTFLAIQLSNMHQ